ncbi:MAG: hypothetical protein K6C10_11790 [Prevotella sp.]|nr:hypothetical protein [Prevotella sp.]
MPYSLPPDINAELLLNYFPEGKFRVSLHGLHKRNSYRDIIEVEDMVDKDAIHATLGRMSLYNSLPEYMFHPIDRFDNLPVNNESEVFHNEVDKQEQEKDDAYKFFSPIDVLLFHLRANVREQLEQYTRGDVIMQQILGDRLTVEQRSNRFIRQLVPYLPQCKYIRGNRSLLTFLLRKVLLDEGLHVDVKEDLNKFTDDHPRYSNQVDTVLGDCYVDNSYLENVTFYSIDYWSDEECNEKFLKFVDDMDELRLFLRDYFLFVEDDLVFRITQDYPPLRLNDEKIYNYLNFNTNI